MAVRYSGPFTIRVNFRDRSDDYGVTISRGKRRVWSGSVGTPRHLTSSVDSPAAYDAAARAALSFADSDGRDVGDADFGDRGYHVSRSRSTQRRSNPRRPAKRKRPSARACSSRAWKLKMAPSRRAGSALRACRTNPSGGYVVKVYYANGRLMSSKSFSTISDAYLHAKMKSLWPTGRGRRVEVYEHGEFIANARNGTIARA